jgi:hypothetical protein
MMLQPASLTLHVNRNQGPVIQTNVGLFQGSILSPLLFSIFIDDLCKFCNSITPTLLFADDIAIKARDHKTAQATLDVCERWAVTNLMTWTIPKCGVVGLTGEPPPLTLDGRQIPSVETYKYLGVPHTSKKVDWKAYIESTVKKYENFFKAITIDGHSWHPTSKLAIWRSFARPILEYCLPIVTTWLKRNKQTAILSKLVELQKDAMKWIVHSNSTTIAERLTGVGTIQFRWESLKCRFAQHLQTTASSNPIRRLLNLKPTTPDDVTNVLSKHKIYDEWKQLDPKTKKDDYPTLTDYLKKKRADHLRDHYSGPLVAYMKDPSIHSFHDTSLDCEDRRAISWRLNNLFFGKKCPSCSERFHRGHLKTCNILQDNNLYYTSSTDYEFQLCQDGIKRKLDQDETNFNSIDYYLLQREFDKFTTVINDLSSKLIAVE